MKQTNEARGKPLGGGSIILTASSLFLLFYSPRALSVLTIAVVVAGIRSGAGPVDCKSDAWVTSPAFRVLTRFSRQRKQGSVRIHVPLFTSSPTHVNRISLSVNSIAQTAAWQLQRTDVRVNALCPGLIETGMTALVFDHARQRGTVDRIGQLNPMGRYGVAEGDAFLHPLYLMLGY